MYGQTYRPLKIERVVRPVQFDPLRSTLFGQLLFAVFTKPLLEFTTDLTAPVANPLRWKYGWLFPCVEYPQQGANK